MFGFHNYMFTRYYYTLSQFKTNYIQSETDKEKLKFGLLSTTLRGFINTWTNLALTPEMMADTIYADEDVTKMWKLFYQKYYDSYVAYGEKPFEDLTNEEQLEIGSDLAANIASVVRLTYDRYKAILNGYALKKDQLLSKLEQTTKSKFNDTPQNDDNYGTLFEDDHHVTNINQSTTTTDTTAMARLKEIEQNYSDIYDEWAAEIANHILYWN